MEEAAGQYNRIGTELHAPEVQKEVKADAKALAKAVRMTQAQKEVLLDAFHPKLIRYYWPVAGAVRTLKDTGMSGLVGKIKKNLGKGDDR